MSDWSVDDDSVGWYRAVDDDWWVLLIWKWWLFIHCCVSWPIVIPVMLLWWLFSILLCEKFSDCDYYSVSVIQVYSLQYWLIQCSDLMTYWYDSVLIHWCDILQYSDGNYWLFYWWWLFDSILVTEAYSIRENWCIRWWAFSCEKWLWLKASDQWEISEVMKYDSDGSVWHCKQ